MSKGSKIVPVRLSDEILVTLDELVDRCNQNRKEEPYNRSTFIRNLICDKLSHVLRAEKAAKKRRKK